MPEHSVVLLCRYCSADIVIRYRDMKCHDISISSLAYDMNTMVNATLSVQKALLQLANVKRKTQCWTMPHILQQTRMRSRLLDGHRSGPAEEVLSGLKVTVSHAHCAGCC